MSQDPPGYGPATLALAGFAVVGAPMVYHIWHTLSELLAGRFDPTGFLIALVLLAIFLGLARLLAGYVHRLTGAS